MIELWKDKNVVVTGAMGFIGSHLCKALYRAGARVTGVDRAPDITRTFKALGLEHQVPIVTASLGPDTKYLPDFDVIFHVAGMVSVAGCASRPDFAVYDNVLATAAVLNAVRGKRSKGAVGIFASSDRVYGVGSVPHLEVDALAPVDVYGATKAAGDILVSQAAREGHIVASLRHVNAYGPADMHYDHLITGTVRSILLGESPVIRSDGSPVKGYLYIDDVVNAYLYLGSRAMINPKGFLPAYNAAPQEVHSVKEIVETACLVGDWKDGYRITHEDLSQTGYVEILASNPIRHLGWKPVYTIVDGLNRTFDWYNRNRELWP